jgi:hypothetical protein
MPLTSVPSVFVSACLAGTGQSQTIRAILGSAVAAHRRFAQGWSDSQEGTLRFDSMAGIGKKCSKKI